MRGANRHSEIPKNSSQKVKLKSSKELYEIGSINTQNLISPNLRRIFERNSQFRDNAVHEYEDEPVKELAPRHQPKVQKVSKYGNMREPKKINVVKNEEFSFRMKSQERPAKYPLAIVGGDHHPDTNFNSIGSTIHRRGSITITSKRSSDQPGNSSKNPSHSPFRNNVILQKPQPQQKSKKPSPKPARKSIDNSLKRKIYRNQAKVVNASKNTQISQKFLEQEKIIPLMPESKSVERVPKRSGSQLRNSNSKIKQSNQKSHSTQRRGSSSLQKILNPSRINDIRQIYNKPKKTTGGPGQTVQNKGGVRDLQQEYTQKRERMSRRLFNEVNKNTVVKKAVKVDKVIVDPYRNSRKEREENKSSEPLDLDLIPGHENSHSPEREEPLKITKTYDYIRSKQAVSMRITEQFDKDRANLDQDKTDLIRELNKRMIQLDQANESKRRLNDKLIDQIKFVRELQAKLGTAYNGNVEEIIDKQMEQQLNVEKKRNIQMKEKMMELQMEQKRLSQEMEVMGKDRSVTVVSQKGNEMNIGKVGMNIENMLKYKKSVEESQDSVKLDLLAGEQDLEVVNRQIGELEDQISHAQRDRMMVANDLRSLQVKYEDQVVAHQEHIRYKCRTFKLSKLGYSARALGNTLLKIVHSRRQYYFNELFLQDKEQTCKLNSILLFRKICYGYREQRMKKYFQIWFLNGLKPMQLVQQNQELTDFMLRNEKLKRYLIRWNHQQIIESMDRSYKNQLQKNQVNNFKKLFLRNQRYAFDIWMLHTKRKQLAYKKVTGVILRWTRIKTKEVMERWRFKIESDNMLIQLNAQAVRIAMLQYKQGLFYAWRQQAIFMKQDRISLLLRTFKQLKYNLMKSRQMKIATMLVIKEDEALSLSLVQKAFGAIKLNREQAKQDLVNERLKADENVLIEEAEQEISKIKKKAAQVAKVRAVKKGVMYPLTLVYKSYFDHWKSMTEEYRVTLLKKIKMQVIKVYQNQLRDAFTKLNQKGAQRKRRRKMQMQTDFGSENAAIEDEIIATTKKVQAAKVSSVRQGNAKFKRMIIKAYKKELKYRVEQWKEALKSRSEKMQKLDKAVVAKVKKRFYRQIFDMYKSKIDAIKRAENADNRFDDVLYRFETRKLRKAYNIIASLVHVHREQRQVFKKVLNSYNYKVSKHMFEVWRKFRDEDRKVELTDMQHDLETKISHAKEYESNVKDKSYDQFCEEKEMGQKQKDMARKTLKKVISGWRNYRYHWAFQNWKLNARKITRQKQYIKETIIQRMKHRLCRDAFNNWRRNNFLVEEQQKVLSTNIEVENEEVQKVRIKASRVKVAQVRERANQQLTQINDAQEYTAKLMKNQVARMIKDRQDNFIISKREHCFDSWRQISQNRSHLLRSLCKFMTKNQLQTGFDTLCIAEYNTKKHESNTRTLRKVLRNYEQGKCRQAVNIWKQNCFLRAHNQFTQVKQANFHSTENSRIKRDGILKHRVDMFAGQYRRNMLQRCFIELFDYRAKKMQQRHLDKVYREKASAVFQHCRFQKWVLRSDQTIIFRQKEKVLLSKWHHMRKRNLFEALKQHTKKVTGLRHLMDSIYCSLKQESQEHAFAQIKVTYQRAAALEKSSKENSQKRILALSFKFNYKVTKYWFNRLKQSGLKQEQKKSNIAQIFNRKITRYYRDVFDRWKKEAEFREIVRFMNEEGPVRAEVIKLQKEVSNLKIMLKDKMIMEDDDIKQALDENEKNYHAQVNKTLNRFRIFGDMLNGESDDWLLPFCLDKLKSFVKKKKEFAKAIKMIQIQCGDDDQALIGNKFQRWKQSVYGKQRYLNKQTQETLFNRNHKNTLELQRISKYMQDAHSELEELRSQREYLIDKVVLGQRLALARCRFSFQFAKEKAWVRLENNSVNGMRDHFDEALTSSVNQINDLKDRMDSLEEENNDIAEQNEGLKEGAMEGLEAMPELEKVQAEVEDLNDQLVDQAEELKQLLMQNKVLKQQLLDAGEEP